MRTDIEIARSIQPMPIQRIAEALALPSDALEQYGTTKAKIDPAKVHGDPGKLVLVTAISPTPAGEGKTTTTIGLTDALNRLGRRAVTALREPSLGPVFGVKGGATGGGYAQVVPMEEINLHFTGDFHAIGAANNLLAAMIDNHIYQGNALGFDLNSITWKRCVDMNDRALRKVTIGLGAKSNSIPRADGYDITVASEIMAILCLAQDLNDLKERLGRIVVGYTAEDRPILAKELKAHGAMTALLRDAIRPNLVQTLEHSPAIIHGGPFANIAHGCNSVIATKTAMRLGDICVTEAGFGADLGAEKFFDIKCRTSGLTPDAVVLVATARALKYHGGVCKEDLCRENAAAIEAGMSNLFRHADNIREVYGLPCIVAINRFTSDTEAELTCIRSKCEANGLPVALCEVWEKGGLGGIELAELVLHSLEQDRPQFRLPYSDDVSLKEKIHAVATKVYRADDVIYTDTALQSLKRLSVLGFDHLPVCIAKTQYSFSDDAKRINAPTDFSITVRDVKVANGAGFVVVLTGNIMTMPGLPKVPAAEGIDVDEDGNIVGLF